MQQIDNFEKVQASWLVTNITVWVLAVFDLTLRRADAGAAGSGTVTNILLKTSMVFRIARKLRVSIKQQLTDDRYALCKDAQHCRDDQTIIPAHRRFPEFARSN